MISTLTKTHRRALLFHRREKNAIYFSMITLQITIKGGNDDLLAVKFPLVHLEKINALCAVYELG